MRMFAFNTSLYKVVRDARTDGINFTCAPIFDFSVKFYYYVKLAQ